MINKSRHLENSYSDWRRKIQEKTPQSYSLDIDFVEYVYIDNKVHPYLLLEITEPSIDLEACSWYNNILKFKSQQVAILEYFSEKINVPWLVVLTKIKEEKRFFKLYNKELLLEKIYSEDDFIKILNYFKNNVLKKTLAY